MFAVVPELEDASLRCSNVLNNNARNINSGSGRLVSMDTELKPPFMSFEVEDDDFCDAFAMSERMKQDVVETKE
jgi:hypothetical protein